MSRWRSNGRWLTGAVLQALCLLSLISCATKLPVGTMERLPFEMTDTLFVSPVFTGESGVFLMPRKLERSQGDKSDYLRVWQQFLKDELRHRGGVAMLPQADDSISSAEFHCPMSDAAWLQLYHAVPGPGSRILIVEQMSLVATRHNWFHNVLSALNLVDNSYKEWGYLQLDYRLYDFENETGSGARRMISREPDTPWISSRMDRAGRLMIRNAKDIARELTP